jgi:hypothetical protein
MIRVGYSPLMLRKIREITAEAERLYDGCTDRDDHCRDTCGLTYRYLRKAGETFTSPSTRVLHNLGLELWVRDPETGESERIDLEAICDWNPRNPQMRASSISSSEN